MFKHKGIADTEKIDMDVEISTQQGTLVADSNFAPSTKIAFGKSLFSSNDALSTIVVEEIKSDTTKSTKKIVLSATIQMTTAIMGSGWLTLPKAFGIYGLALGLIMITFFASQQIVALFIYSELNKTYKNKESYASLIKAVLGKKSSSMLQCFFVLNLFFT